MREQDREQVKHYIDQLGRLRAAKRKIGEGPTRLKIKFGSSDDMELGDNGADVLIKIEEWLEFSAVVAAALRSVESDIAAVREILARLGVRTDA